MDGCVNCANWRLKVPKTLDKEGVMARGGFGLCSVSPPGSFKSGSHRCDRHKPADAEVTAKRVAWLKAMGLGSGTQKESKGE